MSKIKNYLLEDKTPFAKGLSAKKLFIIFVIAMFIGCIYEDIYIMLLIYHRTGTLSFITKRGLLYGELSPIYGWGAVLMIYLLLSKKRSKLNIFITASLIGGITEYLISFLQETFAGSTSWDYSQHFLNINGRTTIPYMFFWGILGYILVIKIYPIISQGIEHIPYNLGNIIYKVLIVFISIDMLISFSACIRMGLRHKGIPSYTFIGSTLDKVYNDERMKKAYTNMVMK